MSTTEISMRRLFDEFVELPSDQREQKISALEINDAVRSSLRMMLAFDELIQYVPDQRARALAKLNVSEPERARLQQMLASDAEVPELLQATAARAANGVDDDAELAQSLVGTSIGTFRLLALIGHGGSSVVFRAERAAGDGSQLVALKLLRTGLYSADAQRRFRREQAILAQLTHPNIAGLIEGGVSHAGIPYIAMELVDGVPITSAANARAMSIEKRLALFCILCRTIEAAHSALVVHRDLKPSNLLITSSGELKVLDFGIARLVDDSGPSTRTQSVALTPEYAAPEQFRAGPLTTAVDIYALGVLLGEMLTGDRLNASTRASQTVLSKRNMLDIAIPSGLPQPRELARRLRGDLDAILSVALAEEPTLRYRSANAFADDIERFLSGRPVRAHAPSPWYRMRKFVARHRIGIALTSMLLCGLLASLGFAVWQGVNARRAADVAQAQAARADSMRDFMFNAFAQAEPAKPRNGPASVVDVVDRAIVLASNDRSMETRARIELLARLAEVLGAQGDLERSGALLGKANEQVDRMLGKDDPLAFEIGRSIEHNHFLRGMYPIARTQIDDLLARTPASALVLRSKLLRDSSMLASVQSDMPRALAESRLAVDVSSRSGNLEMQLDSLFSLSAMLLATGNVPDAVTVLQDMEKKLRAGFDEESAALSSVRSGLSRAYRRLGDLDKAERYARMAVDTDRKIYSGDHRLLANHLNALGLTLKEKRDFPGARAAFRESLRMYEATLGADHPDVSTALQSLAYVEVQLEDYAAAVPQLQRALAGNVLKFGEHSLQASWDRADLGYALALQGDYSTGARALDVAIVDLQNFNAVDWDLLGRTLEKRIRIALDRGDAPAAMQLIDRLADAGMKVREQASYWTGRSDCLRGEILLALRRPSEAAASLATCGVKLNSVKQPEAVLYAAQPMLQSAALMTIGDLTKARAMANVGRERVRNLTSPPTRLGKVLATLPQ